MKTVVRLLMIGTLVVAPGSALLAQDAPTGVAVGSGQDEAMPLSLDEALGIAFERSEEIKLARSRVEVAGSQVKAARSAALPQINANLGYTRTFKSQFDTGGGGALPDSLRFEPDPSLPLEDRVKYLEDNAPLAGMGGLGQLFGNLPFGRKNMYTAQLSATQTLYAGGRVGAALEIASDYRDAARLQLAEEEAEIAYQVKSAYFGALFATELEAISREALAQAERFLEQERARKDAGRASDLDVMRAEVALENLRPGLIEAQNAAELAQLNLKRLVGIPLNQPIELTTELELPTDDGSLVASGVDASEVLKDRPALAAAERHVDIRKSQVRIAKGAYLPSVGLNVSYGRLLYPDDPFEMSGDWRTDWSATVGVQIPLFTGLKRQADVEIARAELEQARLQLAQLREALELEYQQALGERDRARAEIDARQRTVDQAQRVYDLTELRYERGLATQLEVSEARLALLQARTNLAQALMNYHTADAKLVRALGRGAATDR